VDTEEIYLGQFVKPVGVKGELKLLPSRDFWPEILASKRLFLRILRENGVYSQPLQIERWRTQKECYIVKMAGVLDRTTSENLVGAELFIATAGIDVDLPDRLLPFQVMGKSVVDEEGHQLGEVTSVLATPVHDVYEVTGERGSFLVPAVPEFILSMDLARAEIVIRPIPGLMAND
jgi:16S rRNA processing protein RimM